MKNRDIYIYNYIGWLVIRKHVDKNLFTALGRHIYHLLT